MTTIFLSDTKVFIHYRYLTPDGELPEDQHSLLVDQGLTVEIPPQDYDWDRSAYLRDPAGRKIEIAQRGN